MDTPRGSRRSRRTRGSSRTGRERSNRSHRRRERERKNRSCAMSSCVGLLPAPDDYLGSNPSMVHHCRMLWASATQSGHVPSARTCSQVPSARTGGTPKSLQLGLVA
ncbi:hypothetical protein PIB30_074700, partial [Stylosanthes scabra]|nr:hypothetical protein [Stylosanthes scabra]